MQTPPPSIEPHTSRFAFWRKHWYLVLLVVLVIAGLVYLAKTYHLDPQSLLRDYGYYVVLIWTFLEGETIVIIAGMFASALQLNPWLIALCAFGGSFLSDQVMFSLGKYKGTTVLKYFPKIQANLGNATRLFKKYDIYLILGFRFVYGVRNVTPILLGISGVSHKKFFGLNFIGAAIWALVFTFGGVYSGKTFMLIMEKVGHGIFYILLAIIVLAIGIFYWRKQVNKKNKKSGLHKMGLKDPVVMNGNEAEDEKAESPPDIT